MKIEIEQESARKVIGEQLGNLSRQIDCAYRLFEAGRVKEAYQAFPYSSLNDVAHNLETYVGETED